MKIRNKKTPEYPIRNIKRRFLGEVNYKPTIFSRLYISMPITDLGAYGLRVCSISILPSS